jgi:hypothetical protein
MKREMEINIGKQRWQAQSKIEEVKPILNDKLPDFAKITSDLFVFSLTRNVNAILRIFVCSCTKRRHTFVIFL